MKKAISRLLTYFGCSMFIFLLFYFQAKPLAQYLWNWRFNKVGNEEYTFIIYFLPVILEAIGFFILTVDSNREFRARFSEDLSIKKFILWFIPWVGVIITLAFTYLLQLVIRTVLYFDKMKIVFRIKIDKVLFWNNQQYSAMLRHEIFSQISFVLLYILVLLCIHWFSSILTFNRNLKYILVFILTFLFVQIYLSLLFFAKLFMVEWVAMLLFFILFLAYFLYMLERKKKIS